MAPESIDKYRIERELGSGTFATVWLAYDSDLDRHVAIKVLGDNWSRNKDVRDRFLEEARILWRLDDPRIIRVFDTRVTPEGQPYFVMEYADAGSLQDRIQQHIADKKFYTVAEAVAISRDIAQGLAVAHGHRIVHRDLKPSNILFSTSHVISNIETGQPAERLLMADFGIARQLETSSGFTITAGTPYYMAPEQADPQQGRGPDERADIYSAGVILYELLTNRVPYAFDSISQIIRAQAAGERPPIHELRPDVPDALAHVIDTALQPDPYHRYATAGELAKALDQAFPVSQGQPEFTIDPDEYRRRLEEERRQQQLAGGGKGGNDNRDRNGGRGGSGNGSGGEESGPRRDEHDGDGRGGIRQSWKRLPRGAQYAGYAAAVILALVVVGLVYNASHGSASGKNNDTVLASTRTASAAAAASPTSRKATKAAVIPTPTATMTPTAVATATPTPTVTQSATPIPTSSTAGVQVLTSQFGTIQNANCQTVEPYPVPETDATVECKSGTVIVDYNHYVSPAALTSFIQSIEDAYSNTSSSSTWFRQNDSSQTPQGTLWQFINQEGKAELFWTINSQLVSGVAFAQDANQNALLSWWEQVGSLPPAQ